MPEGREEGIPEDQTPPQEGQEDTVEGFYVDILRGGFGDPNYPRRKVEPPIRLKEDEKPKEEPNSTETPNDIDILRGKRT